MPYKLLCCSDTHLNTPPELDETDATAWLHAGDVYNYGHSGKSSKGIKPQQLMEWVEGCKIPIFAVKGNHDCSFDVPFFDKAIHVSDGCHQIAPGLFVIGIGWAGGVYYDLPMCSDIQKVIKEAKRQYIMKSMPSDKVVILTHYPPWLPNIYDYPGSMEGWMFDEIRELADEVKPLAIIQGHVHDIFGLQVVHHGADYDSLVVSPGPVGGTLTIDKDASTASFEFAKLRPEIMEREDDKEEGEEEKEE